MQWHRAKCEILPLGAILLFMANASAGLAQRADEELLRTIEAGVDANLALMREGSARHRCSRAKYRDGTPQGVDVVVVETTFLDGFVLQKEHRGNNFVDVWHLVNDDGCYWIQPGDANDPPTANNVILYERDRSGAAMICVPRVLGHAVSRSIDGMPASLADHLRAVRGPKSQQQIRAENDGGHIKLTFYFPPEADVPENVRHSKHEIWVSPSQGYGVVRQKKWGRPEWPYEEIETSYQQARNGAWVAKRYKQIGRGLIDGVVRQRSDGVYELLEVDFRGKRKPEYFTLTGIGLPKGSHIQDRVNNREFLLDIPAFTEEEVQAERRRLHREHFDSLREHQRRRKQLITYGIIGVLVAAVAGAVVYRMRWA